MDILTLDFETFYSDDYTLKKMTTEAYIRDERFEALMVGVRYPRGWMRWFSSDRISEAFSCIDWSKTAVLCHHAQFDGLILAHHYGIRPALWLDTLSMGRLIHGNHISLSLASLAAHYGLAPKSVPYDLFRGKRWAEIDHNTARALGEGCLHDVELTWQLFQRMMRDGFPREELGVIDLTVRMFTEPTLVGDRVLFERVRDDEWDRKNERLMDLGVTEKQLMSAGQFQALLEAEGVEVETKQGANGPIPALARTDQFMKDLLDGQEGDRGAALANARLDVRSTIDETRAGRLAGIASRGRVPVYLGYCAAHTTRWGGGDKVNFQNLRRGGELRKGLSAPPGGLLAVVDLSQIECRVLNRVAGQQDVLDRFAAKEDVYSTLASAIYGRPITKADKIERQVGKEDELGSGFGMGADKFHKTLRSKHNIDIPFSEAQHAIDTYRSTHPKVTRLWREGDAMLRLLAGGSQPFVWRDVVEITHRDGVGRITGPNGTSMLYRLEWSVEDQTWRRATRTGARSIWGGGLVENLIQYLARLVMSQAMLRIRAAAPELRLVMTTHDEVVYVVPAAEGADALALIGGELTRQPTWLPPIPLDCEGSLSERYEK